MSGFASAPFVGFVDLSTKTSTPARRYSSYAIDDFERFYSYLKSWRRETYFTSLVQDKVENQNFQKIISIGQKTVPWIINEIKHQPDFLVLALGHLVNEDPVQPSSRGKLNEIINDWLTWAERNAINAD